MPIEFLIIGIGSAGQRHARVIRKLYPDSIIYCLTGNHSRSLISNDLNSQNFSIDPIDYYGLKPIYNLSDLKSKSLSLTVIANPPKYRMQQLPIIDGLSERILIEKPLALNPTDASLIFHLLKKTKKPAWVGYQNYFNPIQIALAEYFANLTTPSEINLIFHEDLQSMNPFRDMFEHHLAKPEGGGVLLGLSHDIMFLYRLFDNLYLNQAASYISMSGRFPSVFDQAEIIALGVRGVIESEINISLSLSPKNNFRGGKILSSDTEITWDYATQRMTIKDKFRKEKKFHYPHHKDSLFEAQINFLMDSDIRSNIQDKNLIDSLKIVGLDYALKNRPV